MTILCPINMTPSIQKGWQHICDRVVVLKGGPGIGVVTIPCIGHCLFLYTVRFFQRVEKDWNHDVFIIRAGGLVDVGQLSVLEYHQPLR
ncbi:hypothetical protein RRG08_002733 [Elysia crispata]|uniref:Uncharacterized protein n=1 Tax=Elysia crispata TaxID=231223 RepID=A0AAE1CMN3_9GAST|nr:hypothetical protein RRG08_002733 [Elysia crispata]